MPRLQRPSLELIPSFVDNLREQIKAGKPVRTQEEIAEIEKDPEKALERYLNFTPEEGRLPAIHLWYAEGNKFIGRISIRTQLNEDFAMFGGNIGYSITVTEQRKGHGTHMLCDGLAYCKNDLALKKVLITCDETNIASIKVIEKNGGMLENTVEYPKHGLVRRYWITL